MIGWPTLWDNYCKTIFWFVKTMFIDYFYFGVKFNRSHNIWTLSLLWHLSYKWPHYRFIGSLAVTPKERRRPRPGRNHTNHTNHWHQTHTKSYWIVVLLRVQIKCIVSYWRRFQKLFPLKWKSKFNFTYLQKHQSKQRRSSFLVISFYLVCCCG